MIKVIIKLNGDQFAVNVAPETTLRQILEAEHIDYASRQLNLDGCPLRAGDMDKPLVTYVNSPTCYLVAVQKLDNANA